MQLTAYEFDPESLSLRFTLEAGATANALSLVLPHAFHGAPMQSAKLNGELVAILACELEGRQQVLLPADYTAGRRHTWEIQWGAGTC